MEATMMILEFIFSSFWTWLGSFFMLSIVSSLFKTIIRGRRPKAKAKKDLIITGKMNEKN
jgi:asparagine N-glycosylation enzyme membrane subunit Stt3